MLLGNKKIRKENYMYDNTENKYVQTITELCKEGIRR